MKLKVPEIIYVQAVSLLPPRLSSSLRKNSFKSPWRSDHIMFWIFELFCPSILFLYIFYPWCGLHSSINVVGTTTKGFIY